MFPVHCEEGACVDRDGRPTDRFPPWRKTPSHGPILIFYCTYHILFGVFLWCASFAVHVGL